MSELTVEVDAAEVGLDSERLKRIDAHFAGYVADEVRVDALETLGVQAYLGRVHLDNELVH